MKKKTRQAFARVLIVLILLFTLVVTGVAAFLPML